ncbi:MAG: DUF924 family protein, partial [Casimicrobiaceae bacterium]
MPPSAAAILDFWFPPGTTSKRREWFGKDPEFDRTIRERFGTSLAAGLAGAFGDWCVSARGSLARVILLDQFTRNAFRGTPKAFAGDAAALATAEGALERGIDHELGACERWFMYLPFEHAESLAAQDRSVALFRALADEGGLAGPLEWALRHRAIIQRFGRFPHRNAILVRESTADEIAFLREPNSS